MSLPILYSSVADYLSLNETLPEEPKKPHCSTDLPFSMYAYDHLKGVATRGSIDNSSEQGLISVLPSVIPDIKDVSEFGNVVAAALEKVCTLST